MNLELKPEFASRYTNLSQRTRVLTETWVQENLYCPACPCDSLNPTPAGRRVVDFSCSECKETYQLKSQGHPFRDRIMDSAYEPKIEAIRNGTIPNFLFLRYDIEALKVLDLFLVPRYFMSLSVIERRKPLSEHARRHGWVGSNILLGKLPIDARIPIVNGGYEVPKDFVRASWRRFSFLREKSVHSRGWTSDVLACIRQLDQKLFLLKDVYAFEEELARLHPENKHIRPKIRQQLQVLRDNNIIEFLGNGAYRIR